jgi:hypothetical protein
MFANLGAPRNESLCASSDGFSVFAGTTGYPIPLGTEEHVLLRPLKDAFAALKILTLPVVGLWFLPCNRISQRPHQHMFFSSGGYRVLRHISGQNNVTRFKNLMHPGLVEVEHTDACDQPTHQHQQRFGAKVTGHVSGKGCRNQPTHSQARDQHPHGLIQNG